MSKQSGRRKTIGANDGALHYGSFESAIGTIYVAADGDTLVAVDFTSASESDFRKELSARVERTVSRSDSAALPAVRELREYFEGKRETFSFTPDISGRTPFQRRALRAALKIPYGQTRTYAWLAKQAGSPRAARAAGQVMASNEVPIVIPCHRVIGSSGGLCGFAGGLKALDMKRKLLEIEGIRI